MNDCGGRDNRGEEGVREGERERERRVERHNISQDNNHTHSPWFDGSVI